MANQIDFDPNVDYYKALGVAKTATPDDIKKVYRKLAKQFHPDSTGGDKAKESRFKDISNAYDVLGDAKKRELYDQIRAGGGGMPPGVRPGRGGGRQQGVYTYTAQGGPGGPGVFDVGDLFGQFFRQQAQAAQAPGPGAAAGGGSRFREADDADFESRVRASDGSWLRADGADVHGDVRISFDRAILGTVASVATIDGKADVRVPPGTSSGKRLRLRGKGIDGRGDHYITVQIDVPRDLDDDAKKALVEFTSRVRKRKPSE
jgi:DnaJ-class molecular chaperone|nr:DnaJ domain-containing protein [Kofleriaceae bacterium]